MYAKAAFQTTPAEKGVSYWESHTHISAVPQATVLCGIRQKGGCQVPIPAPQSLPIQKDTEALQTEQRDAAQQMSRCAKFQCREARRMTASAQKMFATAQLLRERMERHSRLTFSAAAIST